MEHVYISGRMTYELISGEDYIKKPRKTQSTQQKYISHQLGRECQNGGKSERLQTPCMYTSAGRHDPIKGPKPDLFSSSVSAILRSLKEKQTNMIVSKNMSQDGDYYGA